MTKNMLQDNPLLAQLKQTLHDQTPRVEGVVKGTDKGFGFLEVEGQKSYFIPPPQMKKVMHGDRISAVIQTNKDKESAEPEKLIEPFLSRFVGRIQRKEDRLSIVPDHPLLKEAIQCRAARGVEHDFVTGDWAVAEMKRHPLKGDRGFYAELTEFITFGEDHLAPWWVTLSRHNLGRSAPEAELPEFQAETLNRRDLTELDFVTIDSASTEDMDDALFTRQGDNGQLCLTVAIADPTAWVMPNTPLDDIAAERAFTNYLPGFNIPMLPRELSDDLCSLRPNVKRPVLACDITIDSDGAVVGKPEFYAAWIESKAKLVYDNVSDWLEKNGDWQPESEAIAQQITLLHAFCTIRHQWRKTHALVFRDRPDYRFVLGDKGEVLEIITEQRRVANKMVEEAMITANIVAGEALREHLGFGIYNLHSGFDEQNAEQASAILANHGITVDAKAIATLEGFKVLRRRLDEEPTQYLDSRIRRFQSFAEIGTEAGPHFGLGLDAYATWTSPIRKYGDMVNHRLLKSIILQQQDNKPDEALTLRMSERRRQHRMAERDVGDWLYARYLAPFAGTEQKFNAEIIDISRGGMRVRLLDNGAVAFIPAPFIHSVRDELVCSQELGTAMIKGEERYRVTDIIEVTIAEVRMETRSVVARPIA